MNVTIYHNPRCSKSRATLALLEERQLQPRVIRYLDDPPSADTLRDILRRLNLRPRDLLRQSEAEYRELGLADGRQSDDELIDIIIQHPKLMQRPIVVTDRHAAIGRPPEQVLEIL